MARKDLEPQFTPVAGHDRRCSDGASAPENKPPYQRFPDDLLAEAREVFGKRAGRTLTNEDARQILENLVGFFDTLNEWDRAKHETRLPSRK